MLMCQTSGNLFFFRWGRFKSAAEKRTKEMGEYSGVNGSELRIYVCILEYVYVGVPITSAYI